MTLRCRTVFYPLEEDRGFSVAAVAAVIELAAGIFQLFQFRFESVQELGLTSPLNIFQIAPSKVFCSHMGEEMSSAYAVSFLKGGQDSMRTVNA